MKKPYKNPKTKKEHCPYCRSYLTTIKKSKTKFCGNAFCKAPGGLFTAKI